MKRTAKYETVMLNVGKWRVIEEIARAYASEKDRTLVLLGRAVNWHFLDDKRSLRTAMKGTTSLPVHLHDQAIFDAVDTMKRHIEAAKAHTHVRAKVFTRFDGAKRHYAFWILRSYGRIGLILGGKAPTPDFEVTPDDRRAVGRFLRRTLRRALGHPPRVRLGRSFMVDETLYRVFSQTAEHASVERQYIKVASLTRGHRIVLPLRGRGRIDGNVRIVLRADRRTVEVHTPYDVRASAPKGDAVMGLDAGVTEVLASSDGRKYGQGFGRVLDRLSEQTTMTGRARNRLFRLAESAHNDGNNAKARRIRRFNLGRRSLEGQRRRGEAEVKRRVGEAVGRALASRPAVVAVEDLSHMRGRTKSRQLSRIVSRWMRSALRERLEFRSAAGGSRLETVHAAYTSQTCPDPACGYVHKDNRHGDRFQCLWCGYGGDADVIASWNIAARVDDPDIRLWTPKEKVRQILVARYRRRSEGASALTAPGKTPAVACGS